MVPRDVNQVAPVRFESDVFLREFLVRGRAVAVHFDSVLDDLDPRARERYFESHQVDPQLKREVESLLRFDSGSGSVLTDTVSATVAPLCRHRIGVRRATR